MNNIMGKKILMVFAGLSVLLGLGLAGSNGLSLEGWSDQPSYIDDAELELVHSDTVQVREYRDVCQEREELENGTIEYTVNLWDETAEGEPDESFSGEIDEIDFQKEIDEVEQYNVFEIVIDMEETAGNSNKRPNVDSLNVEYVENLDRQGLGFNESMFQLFTLFVLIGSGLLALTRSF